MLLRTLLPCLLSAVLAGCSEWPRFANLPDGEDPHPADVDPAYLAGQAITWIADLQEPLSTDNDVPTGVVSHVLEPGEGVLYRSLLKGRGWGSSTHVQITSEDCPGSGSVPRSVQGYDYLYDVNYVRVEVPTGATLCARMVVQAGADDSYTFDLIPFVVDRCGLPHDGPVMADNDQPVGYYNRGYEGEWSMPTEAEHYAVLLGAFTDGGESDPDILVSYHLGVSVVPAGEDGQQGVCPLLKYELPEEDL